MENYICLKPNSLLMHTLGLVGGKVYLNGNFEDLDVYIDNEKIAEIVPNGTLTECKNLYDCKNKLILPGFIDPHVHINLNLGEFTSADDYESASKAAAFGGITTFIDFLEPINEISEFNEKLERKFEESKSSYIDYSFHTTAGNYLDNTEDLVELSLKNGISSIKVFTTYSESNRRISYKKLTDLLRSSRNTEVLVLSHTENDEIIINSQISNKIADYAETRPANAEIIEIEKLAQLVENIKSRLYFVHVTCGSSVELLYHKYQSLLGKYIFIESCPQYFQLNQEVFQTDKGNLYILAPPLRSEKEQTKLRKNIEIINTIGTDHCPFMKREKLLYDDTTKIPKGLGGVEHSFSIMYNLFGEEIIDKFTIDPAKIHNLFPQKGVIKENSDADIVIFDPNKEKIIDSGHSKSDYSPYEGLQVKGTIETTIRRGEILVLKQKFVGSNSGRFIKRTKS